VVFGKLFDRLSRRQEDAGEIVPVMGNDGWVELVGGRVVVHDPVADGRYATLGPGAGIRLWINDEPVDDSTAVTASDQIRYEVQLDPLQFFELALAPDELALELLLTADPTRLADTVSLVGLHQARLQPACSQRARPRPGTPRTVVLERLKSLGVEFGVDEPALEQELKEPTYQPVVIARGQEAQEPTPGRWAWRLDEWSLVEAGQVIAEFLPGQANKPRITVTGQLTNVYEELPEPPVYLAGNGTRLVPGGRLVASGSGRARAVPTPQGQRVHLFPVERIEGDLTGEFSAKADLIVRGNVRGARVEATGEVMVTGAVEQSEIQAEVITVLGAVLESRLCTVQAGHFIPLRAELEWIQHQIEAMRQAIHGGRPVKEEAFREVQAFIRALRRKAEQMGVSHPEYAAATEEIARVFMGAKGFSGLDLPTAGRMLMGLGKLKGAEHSAAGARDVRAASLAHTTVWAGRDIHVQEKVAGCSLFCGGSIQTLETAVLAQSELVAGGDIIVGTLTSVRGTAPVVVRAGGNILAEEVQVGCAFEYGADHKEFKHDLLRVAASANAKGQLIIKQRD
jgi:hypothetical protein